MKAMLKSGQFDLPAEMAAPATPTCCCCCCCCCVASIAGMPVALAVEAHGDAIINERPTAGPTILAVFAYPVAAVVSGFLAANVRTGGWIPPLVAVVGILAVVFHLAGDNSGKAIGKSAVFSVAASIFLVAEGALGAYLVLSGAGVLYLIIAIPVLLGIIHVSRMRHRSRTQNIPQPVLSSEFYMPPPPGAEAPSRPTRPQIAPPPAPRGPLR